MEVEPALQKMSADSAPQLQKVGGAVEALKRTPQMETDFSPVEADQGAELDAWAVPVGITVEERVLGFATC